jgi:fibronectin type 3 domain-containing protein
VGDGFVELRWTNPSRRVDNTAVRDLALIRVFRVEDSGAGEPRAALRSRGQIAGYEEVATVRLAEPAPATVDGSRMILADRQGLTYGRRYTYVVLAEDAQGRLSPPSAREAVMYIAPPAAPRDVEATAGEGHVQLRWTAPDRLVDGSPVQGAISYEIARTTGEGASESIALGPVTETTFTDRDLINDTAYAYAVRALRTEATAVARGPLTAPVASTPQDLTPPGPPGHLVAVAAAGDVRLSWAPSPDPDVGRYVVYRTDPRGGTTRAGSIEAPAATFVDRAVAPGTYRYAVTAQDRSARGNESARSNEATVVAP